MSYVTGGESNSLLQDLPLLQSSSPVSDELLSPTTPTFPRPQLFQDHPCPKQYWASPFSSHHSPLAHKEPLATLCPSLHISFGPQFASRMRQGLVAGSRLIPVDSLPEYQFTPWQPEACEVRDACQESSSGMDIRLDAVDSEGLYWTAYRGTITQSVSLKGQKDSQRVIVKICRPAAFGDGVVDVEGKREWDVSRAEAVSEIEHELHFLRSSFFRHHFTSAPALFGVWNGVCLPTSMMALGEGLSETEVEIMKDEYRLLVVVLEDVGPACSSSELHVRRDEIIDAFGQLHEAGFIHGDIAPRHVRRGIVAVGAESKPRVRLIDFGRTRLGSEDEVREERQAVVDMLDREAWSTVYARQGL